MLSGTALSGSCHLALMLSFENDNNHRYHFACCTSKHLMLCVANALAFVIGRHGNHASNFKAHFVCDNDSQPRLERGTGEATPWPEREQPPWYCSTCFRNLVEAITWGLAASGKAMVLIDVVEWQKRGLPHAHMLLILQDVDKLRTLEDYDSVVQAFLPDQQQRPRLFEAAQKYMVHGLAQPQVPLHEQWPLQQAISKGLVRWDPAECGWPVYRRWVLLWIWNVCTHGSMLTFMLTWCVCANLPQLPRVLNIIHDKADWYSKFGVCAWTGLLVLVPNKVAWNSK